MYEIGDRVILTVDEPDLNDHLHPGHAGTVLKVEHEPAGLRIGVQWDDFHHGHTLHGVCPNNDGWFVWECELIPANENDAQIDTSILDDLI